MVCPIAVTIGILLCAVGYFVLRYIWELKQIDMKDKAIFITGCDSGFGRSLAIRAAKAGITVFAGCLMDKEAQSLSEEARGLPLHTVKLDVTKDESVAEARKVVGQKLGNKKLWAVVNNAGIFTVYGPADWYTMAEYQLSLDVNLLGVVRTTNAFLDLIKESHGRIVTTSSCAGLIAVDGLAAYSAAKYAVEAYSDCIRRELEPFGVSVHLIEPGGFKATNLMDESAMERRVESVWKKLSEEKKKEYGEEYKDQYIKAWNESTRKNGSTRIHYVVDNYLHAITAEHPRKRYLCGWDAVLFYSPVSLLPTPIQDWVFKKAKSGNGMPTPAVLKKRSKKFA